MILRPKHFRAIDLLAGTDTPKGEVAQSVGITRPTLTSWMKDPDFRRELDRVQKLQPHCFAILRMDAGRKLLLNMIDRLEAGEEKLPLREIAQAIGKLVGDQLTNSSFAPEEPQPAEESREMTQEEIDEFWEELAIRDELKKRKLEREMEREREEARARRQEEDGWKEGEESNDENEDVLT